MQSKTFLVNSEEQTIGLANRLASTLKKGSVIALYGDLGSGKTFFTKALAKALNVSQEVTSPTYVLMNEYKGDFNIYHLDLYRIESYEEVLELGLYEIIEDGICIIEWAKVATELLPENTISIYFMYMQNNKREIIIKSSKPIF